MEKHIDYLKHDIRNDLAKAMGYAQRFAENYEGDDDREQQREAVDDFVTAYRRLERVAEEEGHFDQRLIDEMREVDNLYDGEVKKWVDSTLLTVESMISLYEDEDEEVALSDILDPVSYFGEVYLDDAGDELVPKKYGAIVSTKIRDYQKHAGEDAEMFAYASKENGKIETLIGDNGEGVYPEDIEETGKGTEIIETVLDDRSEFKVFTVDEVDDVELPEELRDIDVGALFQLEVPVFQSLTSEPR